MAISNNSKVYLRDALTLDSAGDELALAMANGLLLSADTLRRLGIACADDKIAAEIQSAMLGGRALSADDKRYMTDAFSSEVVSAEAVLNISNNPNNIINPPVSVGMPAGFSSSSTRIGTQNSAAFNYPAGSAFSSTGAGGYIELFNGGNANQYYVWYNVLGGSNSDPAPAGFTGIQVNILPGDSAAAVANKTYAAINGQLLGILASVSGASVTAVSGVIAIAISSLPGGSYSGTQFVSLSSVTPNALFYYTVDGSAPTLSSPLYAGPISIGSSLTLKVLSVDPTGGNSAVSSVSYVITGSAGVATHLDFTTQPSSAAKNVVFATQPVITIKDASNATVTTGPDATALITISLFTGTGVLSGTVSMNAVAGVANFVGKGLKISLAGNKTLRATKADTISGGGTVSFTVDSNNLNISNGLSAVNLLTAGNYTILSEAGITDAGSSLVTGDIAVSPIAHTAITGFGLILDGGGTFSTSAKVVSPGKVYAADYSAPTPATLTQAISDKNTAYADAAGRATPDFTNLGSGEIGGLTLVAGLYKWTTGVTISNDVTISGGVNDVFIFQISGTLTMAAAKSMILSGGVKAENIFWQFTGAATFGTTSVVKGIFLGATAITLQTNASLDGHMYAGTAVALDSNAVTKKP